MLKQSSGSGARLSKKVGLGLFSANPQSAALTTTVSTAARGPSGGKT